ncbi:MULTISPECIES: hypothetical protein [Xenorhabdus]|uniref:hypothetical protein n=1 Tax=Xenorhabdus TaxID=626 RepID=UPI0006496A01|nr:MULTISPECIES: hypothetical protein [Xenorhabdus]KLU17128.1 hypothetical protein AAY47_01535 [Xenorhabdus griffiniae]KOP32798.1 hypothetical protein AFK69_13930 [Xenorhabdus sp. GDc328]
MKNKILLVVFSAIYLSLSGCVVQPKQVRPVHKFEPYITGEKLVTTPEVIENSKKMRTTTPEDIVKLYKKLGGDRGEFETNADFQKRMSNVGIMKMCYPINFTDYKFDPDTGLTELSIGATHGNYNPYLNFDSDESWKSTRYLNAPHIRMGSFEVERKGGYRANSFGVRVFVEDKDRDLIYLTLSPFYTENRSMRSFLSADITDTKKLKGMSYCVVVKPISPFIYKSDSHYHRATFDASFEGYFTDYYINSKIIDLYLQDGKGNRLNDKLSVVIKKR